MSYSGIQVRIVRLSHCANLASDIPLPAYDDDPDARNAGLGGWLDLHAAVPADKPIIIEPGQRKLIQTGLALALPPNIEGQIRPRSGLAARFGVTVLNAPGTIDADYRGEVCVILVNLGTEPYVVERGARIAQLVFAPTVQASLHEVSIEEFNEASDNDRSKRPS
jgi:dUTP pyrophosphatase